MKDKLSKINSKGGSIIGVIALSIWIIRLVQNNFAYIAMAVSSLFGILDIAVSSLVDLLWPILLFAAAAFLVACFIKLVIFFLTPREDTYF